jgi:DNA-binding PadR family transcriptional regulator
VLDRLVRDRLVTKREVEQDNRPDKYVYRITPAGREELDDWLAQPSVRQGGYRDDFFLKLAAASRLGRTPLKRVLRIQREAYLAELSALAQLRSQHRDEPLVSLLIEAAVLHTEANLKIVERAERAAARLAQRRVEAPAARTQKTRRRATG